MNGEAVSVDGLLFMGMITCVFVLLFIVSDWSRRLNNARRETQSYPRLPSADAAASALRTPIAPHDRPLVTADDFRRAVYGIPDDWCPTCGLKDGHRAGCAAGERQGAA